MTTVTKAELQAQNAEMLRRLDSAEQTIEQLRAEALQRRAEVRTMAEALPTAISRNSLLKSMASDVRNHPDKVGVATRGMLKLGRAPRKAMRILFKRF